MCPSRTQFEHVGEERVHFTSMASVFGVAALLVFKNRGGEGADVAATGESGAPLGFFLVRETRAHGCKLALGNLGATVGVAARALRGA
jgi:hypothetical protein